MSVIAFAISTINGGFTIFDQLVTKPDADREASMQRFETNVQQIPAINQAIQTAASSNPESAGMSALFAQKQAILSTAIAMLPSVRNRVNLTEYLILAIEEFQMGNFSVAKPLADAAVKLADNPYTNIETRRNRSMIEAMSGDISSAREDLKSALRYAASEPTFSNLRALTLATWINIELKTGDCSAVDGLLGRFDKEMLDPNMDGDIRSMHEQGLIKMLGNQSRCHWNPALASY